MQETAQYVVLTTNAFARDVTASNATVQAYYEQHKQEFTVPAKMRVRYVAFPTSDREASTQVSDEAVREYYTNNLSDYTTIETNGMETLTALDKVREAIVTKLRREQAQTQTEEQASAFTLLLDPHRRARAGGAAMTFDAAAAAQQCAVHTTDWFTATEPPAALQVDAAFCRSAFALEDDKENCFSEPVTGSNAVYVLAWQERKPEYVPDLDEVRAKVVPLANAEARQAVLRQKAGEVHGAVLKALAASRTFKDAVQDFGLNVSTTATFTVYEGLGETVTNGHAIAQQVVNLGAGEVSEPAALGNDMLIVYAASRQPGDIAAAAALRPQLVDTLDRYQSGTLFNQWGDYLLATAKFEDLRALTDGGGDTPTPATPDREGEW